MLATILIVVMILLQTGVLVGLMLGRRFITEAATLNHKSALY